MVFLTSSFGFQILQANEYRDIRVLYVYWVQWLTCVALLAVSHYKDKPNIVRLLIHVNILRFISSLYNLGDRQIFYEKTFAIRFCMAENITLFLQLVIMSSVESIYTSMPLSFFYQVLIALGEMVLLTDGGVSKKGLEANVNLHLRSALKLGASQLFGQYIAVTAYVYINNLVKLGLGQLQVAKVSMRMLINHLNEALFLRTDDGKLSYCNDLGIRIIRQACSEMFDSEQKMKKYLSRLGSMEFVAKSIIHNEKFK